MTGPPGTGKTLLAKTIAGEAGVPFFYCSGSEFDEMFVGVGARRMRELFSTSSAAVCRSAPTPTRRTADGRRPGAHQGGTRASDAAKRKAPCIIFIDEIDAVGSARNPKDQQMVKMTLNQLLVELDGYVPLSAGASLVLALLGRYGGMCTQGRALTPRRYRWFGRARATARFSSSEGVIVIGATNFPELLDKALVRPGRFDRHVNVPLPDVRGREQILVLHTKKVPLNADVDLSIVARGTPGFSGARAAQLARGESAAGHRAR